MGKPGLSRFPGYVSRVPVDGRCAASDYGRVRDVLTVSATVSSTAARPPAAKPRKALGQHFLVDAGILDRITAAAELCREDVVLEIGPGRGALTRRLTQRAARVIAVELDAGLAAALPARLGQPANLEVMAADARTVDIAALLGAPVPYKVIANLPYYAANPILRRFLELEVDWRPQSLTVMVQREVAESLTAAPGKMSLLSVATQYYAIPRLICGVPPAAFRPPPKVASAVVRLDLRPEPAVTVDDADRFFDLARAGFSAPRKQLRNSLARGLNRPGNAVDQLLAAAGIDGRRRAETLSLEEWAAVYGAWQAAGGAAAIEGETA